MLRRMPERGLPRAPKAEVAQDSDDSEGESAPVDPSRIVRIVGRHDVKVGRWFYPARTAFMEDGTEQVQRNTARDGSGDWVVA